MQPYTLHEVTGFDLARRDRLRRRGVILKSS